ncbi:MAG: hypothetical protein KDD50_05520, partial [Bdellovibrionales bacterium]|nr:hypothetical protein [Bdellovibrionales bacterium]
MSISYSIQMETQPTEVTCGPTCLSGMYRFLGTPVSIDEIIQQVTFVKGGGTLGVHLGLDALNRKFDVQICTHNLQVFDPSWFSLEQSDIAQRLDAQTMTNKAVKTIEASFAYKDFIDEGGLIFWSELNTEFIYESLKIKGPFIAGLSATYLYWSKREFGEDCIYDDINGDPQGH